MHAEITTPTYNLYPYNEMNTVFFTVRNHLKIFCSNFCSGDKFLYSGDKYVFCNTSVELLANLLASYYLM